jgi:hypothetical protein
MSIVIFLIAAIIVAVCAVWVVARRQAGQTSQKRPTRSSDRGADAALLGASAIAISSDDGHQHHPGCGHDIDGGGSEGGDSGGGGESGGGDSSGGGGGDGGGGGGGSD